MSYCKPIIKAGFDCFEFGMFCGMLLILFAGLFYYLIWILRGSASKDTRKEK